MNKAMLLATLTFMSTSVFGVDSSDSDVNAETQEKVATKAEANKFYSSLPLHYAAWKGDEDLLLQKIQKHGTEDINTSAKNGKTPLMIAAIKGDVDVAKILVKNGADLDVKSKKGNTPLINAVYNDNLSMVKFLVKEGANATVTGVSELTPLMVASKNGHLSIVKYLLTLEEVVKGIDRQSGLGNTALIWAAKNGSASIMKFLIDAGADVNIANKKGETALSVVAKLNKRMTNMLKKAGAEEVTTSESEGRSLGKKTDDNSEVAERSEFERNTVSSNKHKKRRHRKSIDS